VADIETLDTARLEWLAKQLVKCGKTGINVVAAGKAAQQGLLCILRCHLQPAAPLSAHTMGKAYSAAMLLTHRLTQRITVFHFQAEDHFIGQPGIIRLQVVMGQKSRQHNFSGLLAPGIRLPVTNSQHPARANHHHRNNSHAMSCGDGNNVEVAIVCFHILLLLHRTNGGNLVAQRRRLFELERLGGLFHTHGQLIGHGAVTAFEKIRCQSHLLGVILF